MSVDDAAEAVRARLLPVVERPGMWGLQEDYRQVFAFVTGCSLIAPDTFELLGPWAITRIRGASDKYGLSSAVAALAARRVALHPEEANPHSPLVSAFLSLICDYLRDVAQEGAPARIQAEYEQALAAYLEAHETSAHPNGTDVDDPRWHEECAQWERRFVPELAYAPDPGTPWTPLTPPWGQGPDDEGQVR